ncbi:M48 family metalloprotease [Elioraea sp.]|uniref:M48 family metallopeptidase n=1 Tax=Elioraea sp. TaxID=2185103 RepID=UPI003F7014CA
MTTAGPGDERPSPGTRPDAATDEGGLWAVMDRQEERLRRSRALITEPEVNALASGLCKRLAPAYAGDIRVYVVRSPLFNASMAPNGMLQVWSGLLLRVHNEAQLAAVIGHELAHYRQRHSLNRFRNVRDTSDVMAFLSIGLGMVGLGAVGSLAQIVAIASLFAYTREQERDADALGLDAMVDAGFAPLEASTVWANIVAEREAGGVQYRDPLTATHPTSEERQQALRERAEAVGGDKGERGAERFSRAIAPLRRTLLDDEVRMRQPARSLVVFARAEAAGLADGLLYTAWGEVLRIRNERGDRDTALALYSRALARPDAPPEAWRGLGLLHRRDGDADAAGIALRRYLDLVPNAPDAPLVRSYLGA